MTVTYDYPLGTEIYIIDSNDEMFYPCSVPQVVCGVHIDIVGDMQRITYRINRGILYEYIPAERVCLTYEECEERCKVLNR